MNKFQTEIVKQVNLTLIKQWTDLWQKAENANIFNSYEWFLTCQKTYGIKEYEIYVCHKEKDLVAILPLFFTRCFGIKVASSIGNKHVVGTPFLVEKYDKELLKSFFSKISSKRNLHITKIDSRAVEILHNSFPGMFFSLISVNPYIDFSEDPLKSISKSTLSKIKIILRKNSGQFSFKTYEGGNNLLEHLKTMFAIDQKSGKQRHSKDIFSNKEERDFYTNIVKYCQRFVQLCFLYYENTPIAYSFNFKNRKIYVGYQTSYLLERRKLSPGKVMIIYMLEKLKKDSADLLDLCGGISYYKQEFTLKYYFQHNLYYSKSFLVMKWWKLINLARRIKQIVFPEKFTRDHEFLFKTLS